MLSIKPTITIEMKNVSKKYKGKWGIKGINASFENDCLHLLVGTNGSGKSTVLKCIMGLLSYEGEITKRHFRIGYAPEDYVMPYYMTVRDFLFSIGRIRKPDNETIASEIEEQMDLFDLGIHAKKPIGKLSNGMRQKVNLIQAFLNHPKILLLDEPLHALDAVSQEKTIELIRERMKDSLVIISTHNPEKYRVRKKRIWKMSSGTFLEDQNA